MEQWKIVKDKTKCTKPDCPLAAAAEYFVVLELPECVRHDLCDRCFGELSTDPAPIYWKAHRQETGKREPVLDLVSLRHLFDRLGEPDLIDPGDDAEDGKDPTKVAADLRYLVALLLIRKRVLKIVDPMNAEQERADLVVIDRKIPEMEPVCLTGPELTSERLDELKGELLAALGE